MKHWFVLAAAIIGLFFVATCQPAAAQALCAPRGDAVAILAEQYGETAISIATTGENILEVYINADTGSFTVLVTRPDMTSCLLASGMNYEAIAQEPNV